MGLRTAIRSRWLLAACVLCLVVGMLAACGFSQTAANEQESKELIAQSASNELDRMSSISADEVKRLASNMDATANANAQTLVDWGIDPSELLAHAMKSCTYTIEDVVVTKSGGVAKAQVSVVDLSHVLQATQDAVASGDNLTSIGDAYRNNDNRAMAQLLQTQLLQALDKEQSRVTIPVDVAVQNYDGMLVADDTCLATLASQLFQTW